MQSLMPMAKLSCGLPCSAGTFLPSSSPHWVCLSCCTSYHKESCSWKPEKQFSISSGAGILALPPSAVSDDVLGKCYPISGVSIIFKSYNSVLFNLKDFTGVSECASWRIVRWFRVLKLPLNPHRCLPPFTLPSLLGTSLFTLSFYTCLPWTAF